MDEKLLTALSEGSLSIDCPVIAIQQNVAENPLTFSGAGLIYQTSEGELMLKMFVSRPSPRDMIEMTDRLMFKTVAGKVIPDEMFFSLSATSITGENWTERRFLPHAHTNLSAGSMVITGKLSQISKERSYAPRAPGGAVLLYFESNIKFPCNSKTEEMTTIDGEPSSSSFSLNVAKFESCGFKFMVQTKNDWTIVEADTPHDVMPENLEVRICEALSFVFGQEIFPTVVLMARDKKCRTSIKRHGRRLKQYGYRPPINFPTQDSFGVSLWSMFDKYFSHILADKSNDWHPLSSHVIPAIRGSEASLDAQALSLCVAVEGIVKVGFPALGKPDGLLLEQVKKLSSLIEESDLEIAFKERAKGVIGGFKTPRAKDKLMILSQDKKIREDLVKIWAALRNAQAHADSQSPEKIEEMLASCQAVHTLLHELVFLIIGYSGAFTDYSGHNWPVKQGKNEAACVNQS